MKGVACIAMIIAHARTIGVAIDTPLSVFFWKLSLLAPVIFFFTLGITMWYQVRSRGKRSLIASSLVLCVLSFADVGRTNAAYLSFGGIHLFGGLALSALVALALPTQSTVFFCGMVLAVMADRIFGRVGIAPSIISGQLFSVFPWITYLFFGSIYRFDARLFRTLTLGLWIATLAYLLRSHFVLSTQDSSTGYLAIGLSLCSILVWIAGRISQSSSIVRWCAWIGQHSLVFYWVHLSILYAVPGRHNAIAVWTGTLILTLMVIVVLERIKKLCPPIAKYPLILILVVMAIPVPALLHFPPYLRTSWCTLSLIFLALHLKDLSILMERGLNWLSQHVTQASHPGAQS